MFIFPDIDLKTRVYFLVCLMWTKGNREAIEKKSYLDFDDKSVIFNFYCWNKIRFKSVRTNLSYPRQDYNDKVLILHSGQKEKIVKHY